MTVPIAVYFAGVPVTVLVVGVHQEAERRRSTDPRTRAATLRPSLDGLAAGICWPAIAALLVSLALLTAVQFVVATALDLAERWTA